MKIYLSFIIASITFFSVAAQNVPIDFEEAGFGADWTWTTFENDTNPALEIIANPDPTGFNPSATVAKFTALQTGQPFAGCETTHGEGIGSFTIDASNSTIRILVWKSVISDVGIKLVREDNWSLGEIKIPNTVTEQWEQIEFDFSSHIGNTYDQIVIFPDFDARESDNIIYFDEIYGDVAINTSTSDLVKGPTIDLFPNPASNVLTVKSDKPINSYSIFSLTGELIARNESPEALLTIDTSNLPKGVYLLKAMQNGQPIVEKFIKK
jgi:hypothetical protein